MADIETLALGNMVNASPAMIERRRRIPESAQEFHAVPGIIPNIKPDGSTGSDHPLHLAQRFELVGDEVQHQRGHGDVTAGALQGDGLGVAYLERGAPIRDRCARRRDLNRIRSCFPDGA